jgi:glutamyl-tRNA reductase
MLAAVSVAGCRASLRLLEQVTYSPDELAARLPALRRASGATQLAVVSTCQRTELYAVWPSAADPDALVSALAGDRGATRPEVAGAASRFVEGDAVRHLMRVAAGLESFVVGEREVVGQVRAAARATRLAGTGGLELHRLLDAAVSASRRVQHATSFASGVRSVASAAVDVAVARAGGSLAGRHVLVVGAGEVAAAAVERARAAGGTVTVCNRSRRRADLLAVAGAAVVDLAELDVALASADVVLLATAAPHPLVDAGTIGRLPQRSPARPLLLLDLSLPRNVAPEVRQCRAVSLVDLADLRDLGAAGAATFADDVASAARVVETEVARYLAWHAGRGILDAVRSAPDDPHAAGRLARPAGHAERRELGALDDTADQRGVHAADEVAV